jgi:hypothetical protein
MWGWEMVAKARTSGWGRFYPLQARKTCAFDKGYDLEAIYAALEDRDCRPIMPLRESPRWWKLYKGRAAIEREFGRLKNEWALLPLRVRGLERVQLHADLTILAKLSCALARARAVPLAA